MRVERTPWTAWLGAALNAGVAPRDFWALSVCEWRALAGQGESVLDRAAFEALSARFPDRIHG